MQKNYIPYIVCLLGPLPMRTSHIHATIHPSPLGRPGSSSRGSFSEKGKVLAAQHDIVTYFWLRWKRWGSRQAEKGRREQEKEEEMALSPSLSAHTQTETRGVMNRPQQSTVRFRAWLISYFSVVTLNSLMLINLA